ncbi:MAG: ADP-ribosylglycohydrolase family protein [Candidatus Coatesbacteria bacterium]|nr:ADP-ribosylglycohydrolase family protein [Candidatus Coatesbacteria bacterium]
MEKNQIVNGIWGVVVGDALGLSAQARGKKHLKENQIEGLITYGPEGRYRGGWSDDSSMTLCLTESLGNGYDVEDIARRFKLWFFKGYMTPYGEAFDKGHSTIRALRKLNKGVSPLLSGGSKENDNGNGSLMRTLPLIFFTNDMDTEKTLKIVHEVSAITHAHERTMIACGIYVFIGKYLIEETSKEEALKKGIEDAKEFYKDSTELKHFERILNGNISEVPKTRIKTGGYSVTSLEASLWAFMTGSSYRECTLNAVNLGGDADSIGAITGGLAGLFYQDVPDEWIDDIIKKEMIENLIQRFVEKIV